MRITELVLLLSGAILIGCAAAKVLGDRLPAVPGWYDVQTKGNR